ncbi:hypothetical protein CYMTET_11152 [Cymbomonas tetramitiformis]|uniref:Uncharacterized protein n=1 Tax=Cymbomonas tetramitiformis TaxID=36881 RepID=A0AAE0LD42_9CHLO|nr:hypothetical protein CYMTET_11152 [Cymbomonas tetramitiformis]
MASSTAPAFEARGAYNPEDAAAGPVQLHKPEVVSSPPPVAHQTLLTSHETATGVSGTETFTEATEGEQNPPEVPASTELSAVEAATAFRKRRTSRWRLLSLAQASAGEFLSLIGAKPSEASSSSENSSTVVPPLLDTSVESLQNNPALHVVEESQASPAMSNYYSPCAPSQGAASPTASPLLSPAASEDPLITSQDYLSAEDGTSSERSAHRTGCHRTAEPAASASSTSRETAEAPFQGVARPSRQSVSGITEFKLPVTPSEGNAEMLIRDGESLGAWSSSHESLQEVSGLSPDFHSAADDLPEFSSPVPSLCGGQEGSSGTASYPHADPAENEAGIVLEQLDSSAMARRRLSREKASQRTEMWRSEEVELVSPQDEGMEQNHKRRPPRKSRVRPPRMSQPHLSPAVAAGAAGAAGSFWPKPRNEPTEAAPPGVRRNRVRRHSHHGGDFFESEPTEDVQMGMHDKVAAKDSRADGWAKYGFNQAASDGASRVGSDWPIPKDVWEQSVAFGRNKTGGFNLYSARKPRLSSSGASEDSLRNSEAYDERKDPHAVLLRSDKGSGSKPRFIPTVPSAKSSAERAPPMDWRPREGAEDLTKLRASYDKKLDKKLEAKAKVNARVKEAMENVSPKQKKQHSLRAKWKFASFETIHQQAQPDSHLYIPTVSAGTGGRKYAVPMMNLDMIKQTQDSTSIQKVKDVTHNSIWHPVSDISVLCPTLPEVQSEEELLGLHMETRAQSAPRLHKAEENNLGIIVRDAVPVSRPQTAGMYAQGRNLSSETQGRVSVNTSAGFRGQSKRYTRHVTAGEASLRESWHSGVPLTRKVPPTDLRRSFEVERPPIAPRNRVPRYSQQSHHRFYQTTQEHWRAQAPNLGEWAGAGRQAGKASNSSLAQQEEERVRVYNALQDHYRHTMLSPRHQRPVPVANVHVDVPQQGAVASRKPRHSHTESQRGSIDSGIARKSFPGFRSHDDNSPFLEMLSQQRKTEAQGHIQKRGYQQQQRAKASPAMSVTGTHVQAIWPNGDKVVHHPR